MAAPSNAYLTVNLNLLSGSTTYVNKVAIANDTSANLKNRFYLDYQLAYKKDTDNGFVGGCIVGSNNYNRHNSSRFGRLKGKYNGNDIVFFNDGGLNTLGNVSGLNITNKYVGSLTASATCISSYYNATTQSGFQERLNVSYTTYNKGGFAQNTQQNLSNGFINHPAGTTVYIRAFVTNEEGTWYSNEISVVVEAKPLLMKYDSMYASYANASSTQTTYYITQNDIDVGVQIYLDSTMNTIAPNGYYVYSGSWYKMAYSVESNRNEIVNKGLCSSSTWPTDDPAYVPPSPYITYTWKSFDSSDYLNACSIAGNTAFNTYKSNTNGKHYQNMGLTILANDGYYTYGDISGYEWREIIGGIEGVNGTC